MTGAIGTGGASAKRPHYTVLLVFEGPELGRFIMARHRDRGWELPGGRVDAGEDVLDAARREWREETGLPLAVLEPVLLHERPDGSTGHVFLGAVSSEPGGPGRTDRASPAGEEKILAVRAVERLDAVAPLAFPDDPYRALAEAVWDAAETLGWSRPDPTREAFVARLSAGGVARADHVVRPHPSGRLV